MKKLVASLLVFNAVLCCGGMNVSAAESNLEEKAIHDKIMQAEELAKQPTPRAVTMISIPGKFTMNQQLYSNYCVPACVQSVIRYIKGTYMMQYEIADAMGTGSYGTLPERIAPYLTEQTNFLYMRKERPDKDTMCKYIYSTVAGNGKPALLSIDASTTNWFYSASSHRVVVTAIANNKTRIKIADPLGGFNNNKSWPTYYEKSADEAIKVCKDVIW